MMSLPACRLLLLAALCVLWTRAFSRDDDEEEWLLTQPVSEDAPQTPARPVKLLWLALFGIFTIARYLLRPVNHVGAYLRRRINAKSHTVIPSPPDPDLSECRSVCACLACIACIIALVCGGLGYAGKCIGDAQNARTCSDIMGGSGFNELMMTKSFGWWTNAFSVSDSNGAIIANMNGYDDFYIQFLKSNQTPYHMHLDSFSGTLELKDSKNRLIARVSENVWTPSLTVFLKNGKEITIEAKVREILTFWSRGRLFADFGGLQEQSNVWSGKKYKMCVIDDDPENGKYGGNALLTMISAAIEFDEYLRIVDMRRAQQWRKKRKKKAKLSNKAKPASSSRKLQDLPHH